MSNSIRQNIPDHLRPRQGEAVMFDSPLFERLSKIHPRTVLLLYVPLILFVATYGLVEAGIGATAFFGFFVGGVLFWTLFEYLFHRLFFHFTPRSKFGYRLQFFVHGVHHQYPQDERRLVMPIGVSLTLALLLWFSFHALMGHAAFAFFPGFVSGYLCYDMIHFSIHHFPVPKSGPLRAVWAHHLAHHFKRPDRAYGVSSPLWDHVFRTLP